MRIPPRGRSRGPRCMSLVRCRCSATASLLLRRRAVRCSLWAAVAALLGPRAWPLPDLCRLSRLWSAARSGRCSSPRRLHEAGRRICMRPLRPRRCSGDLRRVIGARPHESYLRSCGPHLRSCGPHKLALAWPHVCGLALTTGWAAKCRPWAGGHLPRRCWRPCPPEIPAPDRVAPRVERRRPTFASLLS